MDFDSPAFRQSRPVLLTAFTNKIGSIGLSLVPILLVKRGVSTGEGTLVLSTLKGTILAGTLLGGALSDRLSSRTLVLIALLMSACGLGLLPFQLALVLIVLFGILAQLAESFMNVVQRILLMDHVESSHQKEALGWFRMSINFAQIFSYGVAAVAARMGVTPLMLFDSTTSVAAFFVGRKILPRSEPSGGERKEWSGEKLGVRTSKIAFFGCATVLMGWAMFYELFLAGGAGRLEMLHPGEGLRRFSTMMMLNTLICGVFAVRATRFLQKTWNAMMGGLALTALGILVAAWGMTAQTWVLGGMLLITLGEIMLAAMSQYALMRLTPSGTSPGFYYSLGVTLTQCGRILGAALAFPLLIHATTLQPFTELMLAASAVLLIVLYLLKKDISRLA